jgi:hypothetical protein
MPERHQLGHSQALELYRSMEKQVLQIPLKLGNRTIDVEIPVSQHLGGDTRKFFPPTPTLSERLMSEDRVRAFGNSLRIYLDLVFLTTPESRDAYREMLDKNKSNMTFVKGDFAYIYDLDKSGVGLTRIAADPSENLILQSVQVENGSCCAVAEILDGRNHEIHGIFDSDDDANIKAASVVTTSSVIDFARLLVSDLSPVAPNL